MKKIFKEDSDFNFFFNGKGPFGFNADIQSEGVEENLSMRPSTTSIASFALLPKA
jgi:hypothetical protein